jgi:hypothetical protein
MMMITIVDDMSGMMMSGMMMMTRMMMMNVVGEDDC